MKIIKGGNFEDARGVLKYNNEFNLEEVKRMYTIENKNTDIVRGWQAHKIEQRWFCAIKGSFTVEVVEIDNFENPSSDTKRNVFVIDDTALSVLHVGAGCGTKIQSLEKESVLLVMSDYRLGESGDEYRYPSDYFKS
ncbi:MAG: WxcM-like domain-containing protein [Leadbetterella sp.]|nr:WxcM-like domain-containing protein [Leadbetterella sp.]